MWQLPVTIFVLIVITCVENCWYYETVAVVNIFYLFLVNFWKLEILLEMKKPVKKLLVNFEKKKQFIKRHIIFKKIVQFWKSYERVRA